MNQLKALVLCACLSFAPAAYAEDANLITSDLIEIYAEGEDLHSARLQAVQDGYKKAFDALLRRLYPFYYQHRIGYLPNIKMEDLVDHYDITDERLNSNSYRAKITVFFSISAVQRVLSGLGIVHKFTSSPLTLVLPVLCSQEQCSLWQNQAWRDVWEHAPDNIGLLQLSYALGDLGDLELLEQNHDFLHYTYNDIKALIERYQAEEAFIIVANHTTTEVKATIQHITPKIVNTYHMQYRLNVDETETELYERISTDLLNRLDAKWKGINTFLNEQPYVFYLKIADPTPSKWANIRQKLRDTPHILGFNVRSSSYDIMEISLQFDVLPATIASYLLDSGLVVYKEGGETYLSLR